MTDFWNNEVHKKYFEGLDMEQFKHIPEISFYNHNYYIGFENSLLYGHSDDDNTTEWYLVHGDRQPDYLGVSHTSDNDKLLHEGNT